jgi:hypothetical protein
LSLIPTVRQLVDYYDQPSFEESLNMRTVTTAAHLNVMIQEYIDARSDSECVCHSAVYLQPVSCGGCNWNIEVNCDDDAMTCGGTISAYLDELRSNYLIPPDDDTATPAYESRVIPTLQDHLSSVRVDALKEVSQRS